MQFGHQGARVPSPDGLNPRRDAETDQGLTEAGEYFSVIIIHSLLHTGGLADTRERSLSDRFWGVKPHELVSYGQKYKDVLKHCTKEGGSKILYGQ